MNFVFSFRAIHVKLLWSSYLNEEINLTDHEHGKMDITEQKKVYSGFIKFLIYVGLFSVFVLVFLALFNS